MSDAFLGQVQSFAFNFAPQDWALCNGASLPNNQNTALYSLLGNTYGGSPSGSTFNLPDLRARFPIGVGSVTGVPPVTLGGTGGSAETSLALANLPGHTHSATFAGTPVGATGTAQPIALSNAANQSQVPATGGFLANTNDPGGGQPQIYAPSLGTATAVNLAPVPVAVGGIIAQGSVVVQPTGEAASFSILPPYLGLTMCICISGIYPLRAD